MGSLTQLQQSIVIGSILGDGYLRIVPGRKDAFLEVNHSFRQRDYVDWKYRALRNLSASAPKARKGNGRRIAYRFYSRQSPEFSGLHQLFYGNGRKKIPDGLVLDPIMLAVWYMDDGSKCGDANYYLNTQQYSQKDQNKLMAMLSTLGVDAKLNRDKSYWRLRFTVASLPQLKKLIAPHLVPSMYYKLGYNPVETEAARQRVVV